MKITLVRHGQTENNFLGIIDGVNNSMLNDTGRRQCQRLRNKLLTEKYDCCYMPSLVRCVESAFILIGDRVKTVIDDRLMERNFGFYEGRKISEFNFFQYWNYENNRSTLKVESIKMMFRRCRNFLKEVKEKYSDDTHIMIVCDMEVYRTLRYLVSNKEISGYLYDGIIDNCLVEKFII